MMNRLFVARRASISIENDLFSLATPSGIAVRLRAEDPIISNIEPTPNTVRLRAEGPP
jgi:hypothetical protein